MFNIKELVPDDWKKVLATEFEKPYIKKLEEFLEVEYKEHKIYPAQENLFSALKYTPYNKVKVLLLGQDPYHGAGQAHGLSFSVLPEIPLPPSLKNIYKELESDLGYKQAKTGTLIPWAEQGILLLNAVLTVRESEPNSHKSKGWEKFTDAIISKLNDSETPIIFLLWGNYAKKKTKLINAEKHIIIEGIHPSPLSAHNGFFGSKPFSQINDTLKKLNKETINWELIGSVKI